MDFEDVNYLSDVDLFELPEKLPDFIKEILDNKWLSQDEKINFMKRFGNRYLIDEKFRKLTAFCRFVFMNGEYIGAVKDKLTVIPMFRNLYVDELVTQLQFDVIFSEFCPKAIFTPYIEDLIYNLLTSNGIIITPNHSRKMFKNMKK